MKSRATRQPSSKIPWRANIHFKLNALAAVGFLLAFLLLPAPLLAQTITVPSAPSVPAGNAAPVAPRLSTQVAAIIVDANTGKILFSQNMHRKQAQASTTKITTALTVLSIPGVDLNENYKVAREDLVGEASMGLRSGELISVSNLLYGLLLNSGNDAAVALARYAGAKLPGAEDPLVRFVARMNQKAAELGMKESRYTNPHGLDEDGHFSSPYDLSIAGWYALKNPAISKIVATGQANLGGHNLVNLNRLIGRYAGANGVKPGMTDNAGLCLVASATRSEQTVIAVVLNDDVDGYRNDPPKLLDYGFALTSSPDYKRTLQQGAALVGSPEEFIGKPDGNKLLPATAAVGNPGSVVVIPGATNNGAIVNPAVAQGNSTTTNGSNDSSNGGTGGNGGGVNPFFLILFLVFAALLVSYAILRFAPVSENARNIAYRAEDILSVGWQRLMLLPTLLWNFMRPGTSEHTVYGSKKRRTRPEPTTDDYASEPLSAPLPNPTSARVKPAASLPAVGGDRQTNRSARDYAPENKPAYMPPVRPVTPSTSTSSPSTSYSGQNPLSGIFDDVTPFKDLMSKAGLPAQPPITNDLPQPPRPLSGSDFSAPAPRVNSSPAAKPADSAAKVPPKAGSISSSSPLPVKAPPAASRGFAPPTAPAVPLPVNPLTSGTKPASPPAVAPPARLPGGKLPVAKPATPASSTPVSPTSSVAHASAVMLRARQAIDFAYAGRIAASTDEFRRVIDMEPLFDFGEVEGFEQMPILGFKSLAYAYRETGKLKFALLLLDLAIETYPNDLELRNLLRTMQREQGQAGS